MSADKKKLSAGEQRLLSALAEMLADRELTIEPLPAERQRERRRPAVVFVRRGGSGGSYERSDK